MKKSRRFWLVYCAGWLAYGVSLAAVFVGVGYHFDINLLLTVLCNVLPASLLGVVVVLICGRLTWRGRRQPRFTLIHIFLLILFAVSWCFFTLLDLSLLSFIQRGVWNFIRWDNFATQWQLFSGVMAYMTLVSSVYVKQINENLQIEERRNAELQIRAARAEAARSQAELAALRAQLNPHFLFNTLHSLMALVRNDANTAEEAIERFAQMLRYVLQSQNERKAIATDVTFADEWNFVQNYLELERLRLGERLKLTTEIEPAALAYHLPAFSLQPIVENAVKHAIAPRARGGQIRITAHSDKDNLVIEVSDDGTGKSNGNAPNNNGLGLRLVRESLAARFGSAASLTTESAPNEGFKVSIMIPRTNPSGKDFDFSENKRQVL